MYSIEFAMNNKQNEYKTQYKIRIVTLYKQNVCYMFKNLLSNTAHLTVKNGKMNVTSSKMKVNPAYLTVENISCFKKNAFPFQIYIHSY